MTEQDMERRLQKASADIKNLLEDSAVSAHLDEETRALLAERPELLGWYPGEAIVNEIAGIVRPLTGLATEVEGVAKRAVHAAIQEAVGDVRKIRTMLNHVVEDVEGGVGTIAHDVTQAIVHEVITPLEDKLTIIANQIVNELPFVSLIEFMLTTAKEYETRIIYVLNSLQRLEWAIEGVDLKTKPRLEMKLNSLATIVEELLEWLWNNSLPYVLVNLVSDPTIKNLISKIIPVPTGNANFLYIWLSEPDIEPEEREFRKQLVACVDQFVRDQRSTNGQLAIPVGSDAKTAVNLLSEFLSVIFSAIGGFAFRHPKVPSLTLPKLPWTSPPHPQRRPFDGAHIVSTGISRSISYTIKGAVGTVGRGVWEINIHNDAAVEGIASALASFIGALIQSVLHDLFWLLEIREIYEQEKTEQGNAGNLLDSWEVVPEGAGQDDPNIYWGVFLRTTIIPDELRKPLMKAMKATESEAGELRGVIQSYTAYMDAIRGYTDHQDGCSDETISINSVENATVDVKYSCSADSNRCPVIRAYCHGAIAVMTPEPSRSKDGRSYRCQLNPPPPKGATLYVRSNWGGSAHHPISKEVSEGS